MAIFTREAVFLKWDSDATKYCFKVQKEDYRGGERQKPASYARSQYDGSLLIVRAITTPKRFTANIIGEDSASGTANDGVDDINYGTIAQLELAWAATDLKVKSFEDSAYWTCEWVGSWPPILEFDPYRNYALIPIILEDKS